MTENEFLLQDRIAKIKSINEQYDLEHNAYISFSGGKDSTVLSHLVDEALPGNTIPRVFFNTGIEYKLLVSFVERERERDCRIQIIAPKQNIKEVLEKYGYPFKSKEHSKKLYEYKSGARYKSIAKYFRLLPDGYNRCPNSLLYQMKNDFNLKISDKCCSKLKKEPARKYERAEKKPICITGMTREEEGQRTTISCIVTDSKTGGVKRFHPLSVITAENKDFLDWYINERKIDLCDLYSAPYNFNRTGCKGCPFSLDLQDQLDVMAELLPVERKQCEIIWKPVYAEYRRIGYRLRPIGFFDEQFLPKNL